MICPLCFKAAKLQRILNMEMCDPCVKMFMERLVNDNLVREAEASVKLAQTKGLAKRVPSEPHHHE